MTFPKIPRLPGSWPPAVAILGKLGGCLLGGALLWWVATHAGARTGTGTVIVHVAEPDVVVSVGGRTFPVGQAHDAPLVFDLPAGEHRLTMTRGATLLYAETFSIQRGEERILTAWRPPSQSDEGPGTGPQLSSAPGAAPPGSPAPAASTPSPRQTSPPQS